MHSSAEHTPLTLCPASRKAFTVTATSPRGATWRLEPTVEDSGGPDDGSVDLDDTDGGESGGEAETAAGEGGGKGGGCASAPGLSVGWALVGAVALVALRRRG